MSRIGKKKVLLPEGVKVKWETDRLVKVVGPKGSLEQKIHPTIKLDIKEKEILFERPSDQKRHKALHGLTRSLVANMVTGVSAGYSKTLELVGVGYKVLQKKIAAHQVLEFHLGYAHPIYFLLPEGVEVKMEESRGKVPAFHLVGSDKQLIGQVAAKIKSLRKPEPYKGKGIRFRGEYIRRKAGKSAAK